ncbi:2-oxo acid dehydrogenase subunit E2 [Paenibacillus alvei]|uniref:Dihydrolipoamide acetyltransferase component of pyruvate dehydrogenase complex n=1 Tax=Paenibacillus alvei TaxID=44250 RepID=A0ABT4H0V4_PAEAL|nr:dihydrolipoamide acetyltransferase family protein [Paenibacillus alvei]MBG9733523.1 branched-chain alpha-keto acid dehydrogenase subunit E2 [Paenibacillus alvei]MBG9742622.1 branched-chain alpha-keto acid dehydrogenase subunit E2 [Paenibacillus alvei]MCY9544293.1 2-oxo acid dehydrogenase subunit E2 [Paenibacillus alvei]MCY9581568.1 2-oxo acid dehydrogenase subunit E2 [Paenibacillus alvei]MCY9585425.1 2-oxo acid dehydrogenase subunit E2 [Paenibacillus alvei]
MAEKIVMPQLGESVTEGTISKWLVNVGDKVNKYDPVCEVLTDKVTAEVPSTFSGTITEIVVQEDETVAVGTLLCCIEEEKQAVIPGESKPASAAPYEETVDTTVQSARQQRYSPAVLKLAQDNNLDLSRIEGSGIAGRITRRDIMQIVQGRKQPEDSPVSQKESPSQSSSRAAPSIPDISLPSESIDACSVLHATIHQTDEMIPVTGIRKTIAKRMVQSKQEIPHAWLMVECDVTNLVSYRSRIKEEFKKKEGLHLTYLPFFIKSVAEALKEFPILNSQWTDNHIIAKKAVHISIAVATENALFVPVIKDADQKSIYGLAKAIDELITKTKEGKLTQADLTGGTFTVNNTGSFGSVLSAPIINPPQVAILSMEAIVKRPIVINNMIAVRDMMNICLSLDHRVLDGLVCGRFLKRVKQKIESYGTDIGLY